MQHAVLSYTCLSNHITAKHAHKPSFEQGLPAKQAGPAQMKAKNIVYVYKPYLQLLHLLTAIPP